MINVAYFIFNKGNREGAGVTPGLRRRRERAERQKSFMKEQQEAVANGILAAFEKRDELGKPSICTFSYCYFYKFINKRSLTKILANLLLLFFM